MSPLIDLIGSAKGYGWGSQSISTAFESIQTITVGAGGQSTISFSNIPSTYQHLQIRGTLLNLQTSGDPYYSITPAGTAPTTAYYNHYFNGDGSTAASNARGDIRWIASNGNVHNVAPMVFIMDILDYSNTDKFKTIRILRGINNASYAIQQDVGINSSFVRTNSAITGIDFGIYSTGYAQHSKFSLYGIKAAA
jgi:hypothetical protein